MAPRDSNGSNNIRVQARDPFISAKEKTTYQRTVAANASVAWCEQRLLRGTQPTASYARDPCWNSPNDPPQFHYLTFLLGYRVVRPKKRLMRYTSIRQHA